MSIVETGQNIVAEFELFSDWMDKYEHLIELGKALPAFDPKNKTDQQLIEGCQSRVWLAATYDNGLVYFTADSDAIITKGIISLLVRVLSGHSPQEILDAPLDFIHAIGLKENLSPTRANGLLSMVKQMKLYALVFQQQEQQGQK
jgi:cysteine desulfuration protein SufE